MQELFEREIWKVGKVEHQVLDVKNKEKLVLGSGWDDAEFDTTKEATNTGWIEKTLMCDNCLKSSFVTKKNHYEEELCVTYSNNYLHPPPRDILHLITEIKILSQPCIHASYLYHWLKPVSRCLPPAIGEKRPVGAQEPFNEFTLAIKVKRKTEIKQVIYDFETKVSHMKSPILSLVLGSIFFSFK